MMQNRDFDEPKYVISVVTKQVDLHPQTLRHYENRGLVVPHRSKGNIRMYSQRDIELLRKITRLTRDLGINLAGVEVVLHMTERMESLQDEMQRLQEEMESKMQNMHESMYAEFLQMIRDIGNENDEHWQEIIDKLESRF
jgi:MerR family transcriptional regulator/heat shock protein HspR